MYDRDDIATASRILSQLGIDCDELVGALETLCKFASHRA